jgi:hypothetical protein
MAITLQTDVHALELAIAERAPQQGIVADVVWQRLLDGDLVSRLEDGKGNHWFELTEAGSEVLRKAGGRAFRTGTCFNCENEYAYEAGTNWFETTCPACGFYAGDE